MADGRAASRSSGPESDVIGSIDPGSLGTGFDAGRSDGTKSGDTAGTGSRKHRASMKGSQSQRSTNSGDCMREEQHHDTTRQDRVAYGPFPALGPAPASVEQPVERRTHHQRQATTMKIPPANQYRITTLCAG